MDSRLEAVPPGTVNLDTVRALHQTVVSLRTALEVSKNELKALKEKYKEHSTCVDYEDVIEKLTLENHILRRKIIDSDVEKDPSSQNIKFEVTYSPQSDIEGSEVIIKTATEDIDTERAVQEDCDNINPNIVEKYDPKSEEHDEYGSAINNAQNESPLTLTPELTPRNETHNTELDISQITSLPQREDEKQQPTFKTKLELLSKFDVRIKVRTSTDGALASTTSDSDSTSDSKKDSASVDLNPNFHFKEKRQHFEDFKDPKGNKIHFKTVSSENVKMAVPNEGDVKSKTDKFDVRVRITSEENLVVKENTERNRRKDTLNLDVDDLSLRSLSEGDNSVFSEGGTTPVDPRSAPGSDYKMEQEASGNESEEVDDIELIFTTDESKDMSNLQEDLVSIRETDQWAPNSASTTHSTPVLIKFHTLDPDFQPGHEADNAENENQENTSLQSVISESTLKIKRVSLPNDKEIRHVAFNNKGSLDLPGRGILKSYENKSDNMLYRKSPNASNRRLDSVDSLTCEYNRGLSFDNTKSSSFELGSSMDILHREGSVDCFQRQGRLGHRFSVFAETDISKCGTSEDDLAGNLNARRNTCPNPFQYNVYGRPASRWGGLGTGTGIMAPMGGGVPGRGAGGRWRPLTKDSGAPRRDNGAQTELSALPPRWTSDGYLAHKMGGSCVAPTLPARVCGRRSACAAPPARPHARPDDTRRLLLSDLGFTSMVPELSRSADPVWALAKRLPNVEESTTNSTAKFLSRGSYRSPCLSMDRSSDSTPYTIYGSSGKEHRAWRSSLPDVRRDDTEELLEEAEVYLRRSIDNLRSTSLDVPADKGSDQTIVTGQPYIPAEPRQLRLGHTVKLITPYGRIAVGRVRYVGIAGGSAASSSVVVGAEVSSSAPHLRNDGTHGGRRYFLAAPGTTALFVPFNKVVMAWAN